jgi:hypothetical protein
MPATCMQQQHNSVTQHVSKQQIDKYISTTMELLLEMVFLFGSCKVIIRKTTGVIQLVENWKSGYEEKS